MIDQTRSSVPENQAPYSPSRQTDLTPRDDDEKKRRSAGQVDIVAMVRSLQRTAGMTDCFRMGNADCDNLHCDWRSFCMGTPAEQKKTDSRPKPA